MSDFGLPYMSAPAAILLVELALTSNLVHAQTTGSQPESGLGKFLSPAEDAQLCYSGAAVQRASSGKAISKFVFQLGYGNHPASTEGESPRVYYFNMAVTLDGKSGILRASGECSDRNGRAWCGVECDGGAFFLDLRPDASSVVMAFDPSDPRLRMAKECGNGDMQELEFSAHDGVKLEKAEASVCEAAQ